MRVLIVIANHGTKNDHFCNKLIDEYTSMSFETKIYLLSNIEKDKGSAITVKVGSPISDPWSLPFGHKEIFAEYINDYDLFIYSEDDTLITEQNINSFLEVTNNLPDDRIAGFLRYENYNDQKICSTCHSCYHWDSHSIEKHGTDIFAYFTNEHSGAFILTQKQLKKAIDSGEFLVPPYKGRYDMLVTAATDPYTRCGFKKIVCIDRIDDFLLHHLPNVYSVDQGRSTLYFASLEDLYLQTNKLIELHNNKQQSRKLINDTIKRDIINFDMLYFSRPDDDLYNNIPKNITSLLSIGCGDGFFEQRIVNDKTEVFGVPLDDVVSELAKAKGINVCSPDIELAFKELDNKKIDVVLFNDILQFIEQPELVIDKFLSLLNENGHLIIKLPNFKFIGITKMLKNTSIKKNTNEWLGDFQHSGIHNISNKMIKKWIKNNGLIIIKKQHVFSSNKMERLNNLTLSLFSNIIVASNIYVCKKR